MKTKDKVLQILEQNRGAEVSGESIAAQLSVTRSAVWKAVAQLRAEGHLVDSATRNGYRLKAESDTITLQGIQAHLANPCCADKIHIFSQLESTNKTAKEMAAAGADHGTTVIANSQTMGRGRRGRSFCSPADKGVYISFILRRNQLEVQELTMLTAAAALAVCHAISRTCGIETSIKWVNDLYLGDKKICGILTEGVTDFETGGIEWAVLGIGVNVSGVFTADLSSIAASLFPDGAVGGFRNRLIAELVNIIVNSKDWLSPHLQKEYKKRMNLLGRPVRVIENCGEYEAIAVDIDESCRLIVKTGDGSTKILSSGEVSIRPAELST